MMKRISLILILGNILLNAYAGNEQSVLTDTSSMTIIQTGESDCHLEFIWPDKEKIGFRYNKKGSVGFSPDGAIDGVTGGIAISGNETKGFLHSLYLRDLKSNAIVEIYADGTLVFQAVGPEPRDWQGQLVKTGDSLTGKNIRIVTSGTFHTIDATFMVENIIDADVPRMMYSRMILKHHKDLFVKRLYHQLLQANSKMMQGKLSMLTAIDGEYFSQEAITGNKLPKDKMNDGLFYIIDEQKYIGFLADRSDCDFFLMYQKIPEYFASYKTIYNNRPVKAGQQDESMGITCWGHSVSEVAKLLKWTAMIRQKQIVPADGLSEMDKKQIDFIKMIFVPKMKTDYLFQAGCIDNIKTRNK